MKLTLEEIIKATKAEVLYKKDLVGIFSLSTDTRTLKPDQIYLPLRGENFDGHNFIDKALDLGARGYFTQDRHKVNKDAHFVLYVKNTLIAYLEMSKYAREKINPITIAITGSSGKTSVKEMVSCVCSTNYKTHKSKLNHNNEIGLCETIMSMEKDTEVLVIEMGMRNLGEIELLSKYSTPDIAIITNIGPAHVGRLGNINNIAKAKCEIASYLHEEGSFIASKSDLVEKYIDYNGNKILTANDSYKIIEQDQNHIIFVYEEKEYELMVSGEYNVQNAILVIETAKVLGMPYQKIYEGLKKYVPIEKRWEVSKIKNLNVINDSYNANPDSMRAVLKTFSSLYEGPLTVVLGDMGELGKDEIRYHREIGDFLNDFENLSLVAIGNLAKYIDKNLLRHSVHFEDKKNVAKYLLDNCPKGSTLLFKASRAMELEKIIEEMKNL